ncbi:MAG: tRNA (N(6)-L-threonylcarbamoyladenosine(37)-C(2))-methylthiotransferase MtaB [candidate division KSB1 bacterium]|nr:tRNA (N(6)-L-threonylcarbamoyladenosine(37)-C(2))-methylthiotransferase MtaB [candidate division KSB1 bacterium]MDZ7302040.1 tRNA (N(6)-L-threonylcarbamoyladenosine(37)-C(2))-methylthiotransferase MtaB [candidate division KSB1 bacterium]MDZ7311082.1 tRNA (N(6)-L-threonylcarbamoyladenosine(37)-C(2))-methylthiotransferase MtaB [candidate division KSB1 bacterium]
MTQTKLKASFYTLGCRLNQAETALISNMFRQQGYEVVEFGQPADVCVINSCTVTEQADSKCRQLVRQVLRKNPETFVAVAGCYAQIGAEALRQIEGIDLIVGTQDKLRVVDFIDDPVKLPEPRIIKSKMTKAPFTIATDATAAPTTRANLKIQDGCDFMCSFCVIPFARGRARSRAFWDIQREAVQLVEAGHKEIVLTGVNIGTYRFEDKTFLDVVKMLLTIPGLKRLRLSSIEPTTIPLELIDLMADSEVLCPHLHVPVQSGDDGVLVAMKRVYTIAEYLRFIEYAATRVPDILIGTDLMVGFPGESEAAFHASCDLLQNSPLTYAHVFTFSERGGTAASRLKNKVPPAIKKARSAALHRLSEEKKLSFYRRFLGRQLRVLTEEQNEHGQWVGFSDNYLKVAIASGKLSANSLVTVRLASASGEAGVGEVVREI